MCFSFGTMMQLRKHKEIFLSSQHSSLLDFIISLNCLIWGAFTNPLNVLRVPSVHSQGIQDLPLNSDTSELECPNYLSVSTTRLTTSCLRARPGSCSMFHP